MPKSTSLATEAKQSENLSEKKSGNVQEADQKPNATNVATNVNAKANGESRDAPGKESPNSQQSEFAKPINTKHTAREPKPKTKPPHKHKEVHPYHKIKQEDLEQVGSMSPVCNELKKKYDDCFNSWFATEFLTLRQEDMSPCAQLMKEYTACVKAACATLNIPLDLSGCPPIHRHSHHHPLASTHGKK